MKRAFKSVAFKKDSLAMIEHCNSIVANYMAQGLRLTLRQLYYQLVTRNRITNQERSYKRLSSIVSDARLAGLMDWSAIEDRVRVPRQPAEFDDLADLVEAALRSYRLPRWRGQSNYVELWVEKDALAGVLAPLASEFHVTLMVNRGYSSQSAMYESAQRFLQHSNQRCTLLYLGDHDPSGEDMVRDLRDRLAMFGVENLDVIKLGLTMQQVRTFNPPPNPAKLTDPRAAAYIAEHGAQSWEVDALPPDVLARLIRDAFVGLVDVGKMDAIKEQEELDKDRLRGACVE